MEIMEKYECIKRICERAEQMGIEQNDRVTLFMDLDAVAEKTDINLLKLLNFDDENFAHDVVGIQRHLDRNSKELKNHFVPRSM